MLKTTCLAALACSLSALPTLANEYYEYPVEPLAQAIPRSHLTGRAVAIPPYRHIFPIRVYTTPPQPPYYNVPPYEVVTPY